MLTSNECDISFIYSVNALCICIYPLSDIKVIIAIVIRSISIYLTTLLLEGLLLICLVINCTLYHSDSGKIAEKVLLTKNGAFEKNCEMFFYL